MSQSVTVSVAIPLSLGSVMEAEAVNAGSEACEVRDAVGRTIAVPFSTADVGTRIPDDEEAQVAVAFSPLADWVLVGAKTESVAVAVST